MKITRLDTGTPWETRYGYARAVRAGEWIAVSGTVAADAAGEAQGVDAYSQARAICRILESVLGRLGSRLDHVLRLRVYYVDPDVGSGVAQALQEAFPDGLPALTGVRVAALFDPQFLLEVEADAVVADWEQSVPERPEWDEPVD